MGAVSNGLAVDAEVLTLLKGTGAPLETLSIKLFQNNFTPGKGSLIGDFTVCSFDGYANVVLLAAGWSDPYLNMAGDREMSALAQVVFESTGDTTPEMAYGWYCTDNVNADWFIAERFPAAIPIGAVTGDRIAFIPRFVLNKNGLDGSAAVIV